jgi:bacterioferritin-associated ferredoxin
MYVCNCNGIRERQLLEAAECGARQPCDVFFQNKCAAKCGRCIDEMKAFLTSVSNNYSLAAE